jgi:hypothetical protein
MPRPQVAKVRECCQRTGGIVNPLGAVTYQDGTSACIVIDHIRLPKRRFSVRKYILALEHRGYCAYVCHPSVDGDINIEGVIHFQVEDYPTFFALQPCIDCWEF